MNEFLILLLTKVRKTMRENLYEPGISFISISKKIYLTASLTLLY